MLQAKNFPFLAICPQTYRKAGSYSQKLKCFKGKSWVWLRVKTTSAFNSKLENTSLWSNVGVLECGRALPYAHFVFYKLNNQRLILDSHLLQISRSCNQPTQSVKDLSHNIGIPWLVQLGVCVSQILTTTLMLPNDRFIRYAKY